VAWPFLISRARDEDYRLVVLPEILAGPGPAAVLQASVGGSPGEPGSALVRELRAATGESVTAVYQVRAVFAQDYGIPGEGLLKDAHGRPVLMTEGVVLRRSASSVIEEGVPAAALDQARQLVTPSFRDFWKDGSEFTRQVSRPFVMPRADARHPRLRLKPTDPVTSASSSAGEETASGSRGRLLAIAAFALGAAVFVAVVITGLILLLRTSHSPPHPRSSTTAGTHSSPKLFPSAPSLTPSHLTPGGGTRPQPGRTHTS
jgi:hypothetical protein